MTSDGLWGRGHLALAMRRKAHWFAGGMRAYRRERGQDALAPKSPSPLRAGRRALGAVEGETPSLRRCKFTKGFVPETRRPRPPILRFRRGLGPWRGPVFRVFPRRCGRLGVRAGC